MQPRISNVQLKLFAYIAAAYLLLITCSSTQPRFFANAVDIPTIPKDDHSSQPVVPLLAVADSLRIDDDDREDEQSSGYMPDFAYFGRSLLGRAAEEVDKLKNDEKMDHNINPDTIAYFVLEKSQLKARSESNAALDALDTSSDDGLMGQDSTNGEVGLGNTAKTHAARQAAAKKVWVSANTCRQPMPGNNASSIGAPQLTLYVSTSAQNQKPGPESTEHLAMNKTGVEFENGYISFEVNATSDVYIGISAPKLNDDWFGSWHFEVAASTEGSYHSYNRDNPFLFMVDTDSESTLFITYNLTNSNKTEDVARWQKSNPFAMYAFPAGRSPVTGMENSYCALQQKFDTTNNIFVDTQITTKFGAGYPKSQFSVHNLTNAQTYNGYLVVEGNQDTVNLPGVGRVRNGGKVFQQFNWTTKADDSCQVLTDLEFCDNVAYAVPSSLKYKNNDTALKELYDNQARSYFKNFQNSLDQIACDAPSTAKYSLARDCSNCREDYKTWLCSVLIPRCEDWTANHMWLQPRNINVNATFPNGTIAFPDDMSADFNATRRERSGYSKSRNPMIDDIIKPGPYKEMLPCEDLCYDIVRSCPAQLGFSCPTLPGKNQSYGKRDPEGNVLKCSFPGAVVKLNVQGAASSLRAQSGNVALIASALLTIVISW